MRSSSLRATSFALLLVAGLARAEAPARLELDWELLKDGSTIAVVSQKFVRQAGRYEMTEVWQGRGLYRLLGSAKRTSRGEVVAQGLRPLEYSDERTGRDTEHARFDWRANTVTYEYKDGPKTIPLPANPRDKLQFLLEFMFQPPKGQTVALDVIDGRGVSDQVYQVDGRERLDTQAGGFDAVKLVRRKNNGDRAEIWLAVDRGYLPVRVLIVDHKGTRLDQVLTRVSAPER